MYRWEPDVAAAPDLAAVDSPDCRAIDHTDFSKGEPVGRGGNADVYRASVPDVDGPVALKEPRLQGTVTRDALHAFAEEAERWANVDDHDHVVGVLDWGGTPMPWIAMEYLAGGSLRERLDGDGEIDLTERLWIGICLCRAVRYAHRHGIAHLDLKPANVLFAETGPDTWDVPKVTDWGLAAFLIDHSGSVEGLSPEYAAPEQFDPGEYGDPSDFTDIYQLGCVLFELLTGETPFDGSGVTVMHSILNDEPRVPTDVDPDLPAELDPVLRRALAKQQHDRQETVVDIRRELESVFDGITGTDGVGNGTTDAREFERETVVPAADDTADVTETGQRGRAPRPAGSRTGGRLDGLFDGLDTSEADIDEVERFVRTVSPGTIPTPSDAPLRFPVESVSTGPGLDAVASGTVRAGSVTDGAIVAIAPRELQGTVDAVVHERADIATATPGDQVALSIGGAGVDAVSRGDVVGPVDDPPMVPDAVEADVLVTEHPSVITAGYTPTLRAHTANHAATIESIDAKLDPETGTVTEESPDFVQSGDAARVTLEPQKPLVVDRFVDAPETGVFVLRDMGQTVAIGVVRELRGADSQARDPATRSARSRDG